MKQKVDYIVANYKTTNRISTLYYCRKSADIKVLRELLGAKECTKDCNNCPIGNKKR